MAEKVQLSNEQIKTIVAVLMFSGVVGFFYWKYLWAPYSKRAEAAETKIESINKDIAKAMAMSKRLDNLNKDLEVLRRREKDAEIRLPTGTKVPDMITTLVRQAREYQVSIVSINPQGKTESQYYSENAYGIVLNGKYNDVGRFLSVLSTLRRIMDIRGLNINNGSGGSVNATFTLVTYQYKG